MRERELQKLSTMPKGLSTELTEFVNLRGRAMHAGTKDFHTLVRAMTPSDIRQSGQRAVSAISQVTLVIARRLW
jgi:hypothetical protein